jgi:hypothetical protein
VNQSRQVNHQFSNFFPFLIEFSMSFIYAGLVVVSIGPSGNYTVKETTFVVKNKFFIILKLGISTFQVKWRPCETRMLLQEIKAAGSLCNVTFPRPEEKYDMPQPGGSCSLPTDPSHATLQEKMNARCCSKQKLPVGSKPHEEKTCSTFCSLTKFQKAKPSIRNNPSIQENKCHQETVTRALNFGKKTQRVSHSRAMQSRATLQIPFFFRHCRAFPLPVSGRLVVLDGEGFLVRKAILSGNVSLSP